jgi:peptidoglycan/LPS O-acetylase OafA/YrhL
VAGTAASGATVPEAVAPPPHHPRFPLSDGLRGVAAIAVVLVHAWLFGGTFGGLEGGIPDTIENRAAARLETMVVCFFLLSAFLLYRPMIAHRGGGPSPPRVATYGKRRFLRIYPAYWVALTVLAIVPGLAGVFGAEWWAYYSVIYHLDLGFGSCSPENYFQCGLPQTWTLATEITFYAILPLYVGLTALLARGLSLRGWIRAELVLLVALTVVSLVLNVPLRDEAWFRFTFMGHFYWLALGLGLAVLSVGLAAGERPPRVVRLAADRPLLSWAAAFAIYLATVAALPPTPYVVAPLSDAEYLALHLAQGMFAALVLIPAVFGNPNLGLPRRILAHPLIMWVGLISYGIYLWHVTIAYDLGIGGADAGPLVVLIGTVLVAVPLATASYYLIEAPLMRLKDGRIRDALSRRAGRERRGAGA